jgi:hypothetical protein
MQNVSSAALTCQCNHVENNCARDICGSLRGGYEIATFRDVTECSPMKVYRRIGGQCVDACCLLSIFYCHEQGGNVLLPQAGKLPQD